MQRLDLHLAPEQLLAQWPVNRPLAAILSQGCSPHARWSILASPARQLTIPEALAALAKPLRASTSPIPFTGGLIGWLSYDLGRDLEPKAAHAPPPDDDRAWPRMQWADCPNALIHDHANAQWWGIGDFQPLLDLPSAADRAARTLGPLTSRTGREGYLRAVERALEYIRAGDVYQVNLAHRLSAPFEGDPRTLFAALLAAAAPWYGAYLEHHDTGLRTAIASASPELFLAYDPATTRLTTRPMKGTRPADAGEAELRDSAKDRAELAMIVDLMRNDLGRVCELGSIRVDDPRAIERHGALGNHRGDAETQSRNQDKNKSPASIPHPLSDLCASAVNPGLLQTTATVSGSPRAGASPLDILRATFPGGSVTGAPKIRAMQIIDELEPVRRGPYCGAVGFLSDSGHFALNLAIRTAAIRGTPTPLGIRGTLDYSVGAGIVADSEPAREWAETLDKAGVLRAALAARPHTVAAEAHP